MEFFDTLTEEGLTKLKRYGANLETLKNSSERAKLVARAEINSDERADLETYFRSLPQIKGEMTLTEKIVEDAISMVKVNLKIQNWGE
jgi:hypothetical protein